ncbi:MAG: cytochrome b/b6 domain-containing protein, partial [Burkholderiaceae bacterium]
MVGSVVSVKMGEMELHGWLGVMALSLLFFRLIWGFVGSHPARFKSFVVSPRTTIRYLRSHWPVIGHNPLGAWSVLALIGLALLQAFTGLGTSDDIFFDGPLVAHLPNAVVEAMGSIHLAMEPVIYGMVGLHVAAIAYYRLVRREDLLSAMLFGDKEFSVEVAQKEKPARDDAGLRWTGLMVFLISLIFVAAAYLSL